MKGVLWRVGFCIKKREIFILEPELWGTGHFGTGNRGTGSREPYGGTQVPRCPGTGTLVYKEKSRERATTAPHDKHKSVQSRGAFMH